MIHFYFKKLLQSRIQYFRNPHPKYYSQTTQPASLLEFLRISCGLSPERALTASKFLRCKIPKGGDSVLTFLKSQGFSNTHIKTLITKSPRLLCLKPETNLGPKIQFFKENGFSEPDLVNFLVKNSTVLTFSLEKRIKPSFDFLHSLLGTDRFIIESLKRSVLWFNVDKTMVPNVSVLKKCGVPDHHILKFLNKQPRTFMPNPDRFNEVVSLVQEMGFQPSTFLFMEAVRVMGSLSRPVWDMKFAVYRSFGCSDEEISLAFRRHPKCIALSEEKIRQGMDFFVKELGWSPSYILACPAILFCSMEKRILPRYRFLQVLASKGLIKQKKFKSVYFISGEKQFFKNYAMKYEAKVPDISKVYEGIIGSKGLPANDGEECTHPQLLDIARSLASHGKFLCSRFLGSIKVGVLPMIEKKMHMLNSNLDQCLWIEMSLPTKQDEDCKLISLENLYDSPKPIFPYRT